MFNFNFLENGLVHRILCMIFQEKCFSCHTLLNDQISFPDYLYFLRYWSLCVLEPVREVINFETNLIFLIKPFFDMTENSKQKFKYFENEKRF